MYTIPKDQWSRMRILTLSNFSKVSARRGIQPVTASPAAEASHEGQPAATSSRSLAFGIELMRGKLANASSGFTLLFSECSSCNRIGPLVFLSINEVLLLLLFMIWGAPSLLEDVLDSLLLGTLFGLPTPSSIVEGLLLAHPMMQQ